MARTIFQSMLNEINDVFGAIIFNGSYLLAKRPCSIVFKIKIQRNRYAKRFVKRSFFFLKMKVFFSCDARYRELRNYRTNSRVVFYTTKLHFYSR